MRPVIGINSNFSRGETQSASFSVRANYTDAVTSAGGIPIILPCVTDVEIAKRHLQMCDGIIFVGGADITPAKYGEVPHPTYNPLSQRRENYDFALYQEVLKAKKPFLGICLGCQELNVALGGTLVQDIHDETSSPIQHSLKQGPYLARHDVEIVTGTLLHDLVGTTTLNTNSAHHQAVEKPGEGLTIAARCVDGTIESIELEDYPFGLAVQWHPEYLTTETAHLKLFQGLVRAAAGDPPKRSKKSSTSKRAKAAAR